MAERNVDVVSDGWSYLECPRWHEGRLWVSDFYTEKVVAIDDAGHHEVMAEVPAQPSGLGFLPDGRALIVSMRDHRILRRENDGSLVEHADLSGLVAATSTTWSSTHRGGAYVGNFGFDLMGGAAISSTTLTYVDPDGAASTWPTTCSSPTAWCLRDGVLVVAETFGARLTAFDVADDGGLARRPVLGAVRASRRPPRTSARRSGALPVAPDGICADADGAIWVADALHGRLLRVAEGGEILEELPTGTGVYACMLGGEDGRTLYACAAPSFAEHERRPVREAQLLAARVDVPHAGRP